VARHAHLVFFSIRLEEQVHYNPTKLNTEIVYLTLIKEVGWLLMFDINMD
jgi:hypothetical protein